jgi:hypothetical protein
VRNGALASLVVIAILAGAGAGYFIGAIGSTREVTTVYSYAQILDSQGMAYINGTVFDVAAVQLNDTSLSGSAVFLFRNVTFTNIPNTSNGTRWMEFSVLPVGSNRTPQDLKAYWWPPISFSRGDNEAFTSGMSPIVGVMMKPNDTAYVYLLVSNTGPVILSASTAWRIAETSPQFVSLVQGKNVTYSGAAESLTSIGANFLVTDSKGSEEIIVVALALGPGDIPTGTVDGVEVFPA